MTFDASETSDGRPIELYAFTYGGNVDRYTNGVETVTVGNIEYAPIAIKRSAYDSKKGPGSGDLTVTVPETFTYALESVLVLPSFEPTLEIFRLHLSDADAQTRLEWSGFLSSVNHKDGIAVLRCQSIERIFNREVPRASYTGICGHVLYDNGCQVNKEAFKHGGTISVISGLNLTIPGLGATADSLWPGLSVADRAVAWQGGFLTAGGEWRSILEGNIGGDPNTVRINLQFQKAGAGSAVEVFAGCNHTWSVCHEKFSNTLRFGGAPFIPSDGNPFNIDLIL